jgi:steroid delta-isomerase-like uncharacterized protein
MATHTSRGNGVRMPGFDRLSRRGALRSAAGGGFLALAADAAPRAAAQATPMAMPAIVERWAAALNTRSPEQVAALFTDDGIHEDLAFEFVSEGKEGIATFIMITLASVPDSRVELVDAFQAGDRAAAHWIWSGTYTGEFGPELPATGRPFAVPIASLFELEGDLITYVGDYYSLATWLRQVGLPAGPYTPPGASPAATPPA